jgi:hypothetical protein
MNLENSLYQKIEFETRRKRGLIQTRYMSMSILNPLDDDNSFLGGSGSPKFIYPEPSKNPWETARRLNSQYQPKESLLDSWQRISEQKEESPIIVPPLLKPWKSEDIHKDIFENHSWGRSFEPTDLLTSETHLGTLHIHCTGDGLLTGAKLFDEEGDKKISNYEAAMLDLSSWKKHKKKGFGEW